MTSKPKPKEIVKEEDEFEYIDEKVYLVAKTKGAFADLKMEIIVAAFSFVEANPDINPCYLLRHFIKKYPFYNSYRIIIIEQKVEEDQFASNQAFTNSVWKYKNKFYSFVMFKLNKNEII